MGLMSEAQRAGRWSQEVTRDGDSDDSAMQWALSSLSHGGVYRHLKPRSHWRTQTGCGPVTRQRELSRVSQERFSVKREQDVVVEPEHADESGRDGQEIAIFCARNEQPRQLQALVKASARVGAQARQQHHGGAPHRADRSGN